MHDRKKYRAAYHLKNRDSENKKNRARYHAKYKLDPEFMKRRRAAWREYASRMGSDWVRLRSKSYQKAYADLSPLQRFKIREAYKKWATLNWGKRVEYAREYRRRHPLFGFRKAIAEAARTGNLRDLAVRCELAFARAHEDRCFKRNKPRHRKGSVPLRRRDSQND